MSVKVTRNKAPLSPSLNGLSGHIWVLDDGKGATATIWPEIGFNLISWTVPVAGTSFELIHQDPHLFEDGKPTRSGNPVLFPFPNRIVGGKYTWDGKTYQLARTGDQGTTAIHGFACRTGWKVIETGEDEEGAWITGEFLLSRDAPLDRDHWPAEARLRLTYRLQSHHGKSHLRLEAVVDSPGGDSLPFGLGYHPYFAIPKDSGAELKVPANAFWELEACIPTGRRLPLDAGRDLSQFRSFDSVYVDDVLGELPEATPTTTGLGQESLHLRGEIHYPQKGILGIWCDRHFREIVVFTPPSRDAFCIEPYTCPTNAINMPHFGANEGWIQLPPNQIWTAINEWTFG